MPKLLEKSESLVIKIVGIQGQIANGVLLFMMAIISFDVIGRNFFNHPLKGTYEMTELSSAMLVFLALAITHQRGNHITIDFLVERFSKKAQNLLLGVVEMVIALVVLLIAMHIFENGLRMMERNSATTDLGLPVYPFLFIIAFTLTTFMLLAFFKAIAYFRMAVIKG
ncbi:TRAP transporter small permease [Ornithinibacillus sp. BX22]|uniref:TRAP transporter small permease n=2 Tax=Ornithinibacillus TaxID=484508 RepID=A0A923RJJ5_9BACI|nr:MULTISPECIES: TRAP transporter small permease [Ornithinibacillus]MBC5638045.1 TRAP transporter small permease [Ornithinibacillus hominis]MBS3681932.1 TRAP transporter small permease [Ornithinibacillus massiliensis]